MLSSLRRRNDSLTGDDILHRLRTRLPGPLRLATADTPLAQLPMDSIDFVELLCLVDDLFGVRLEQAELDAFRTVGELANAVARSAGSPESAARQRWRYGS
jgi:acyl carrier protein